MVCGRLVNHVLLHGGSRHAAMLKPHGEQTYCGIEATWDVPLCRADVGKSVHICESKEEYIAGVRIWLAQTVRTFEERILGRGACM